MPLSALSVAEVCKLLYAILPRNVLLVLFSVSFVGVFLFVCFKKANKTRQKLGEPGSSESLGTLLQHWPSLIITTAISVFPGRNKLSEEE